LYLYFGMFSLILKKIATNFQNDIGVLLIINYMQEELLTQDFSYGIHVWYPRLIFLNILDWKIIGMDEKLRFLVLPTRKAHMI
jgi:hypothetical protein